MCRGDIGNAAMGFGFTPGFCQPRFREFMDGIQAGNFNENFRRGGHHAVYKFKIAEGGEEWSAAAQLVLPVFSRLKSQHGKKARHLVKDCGRAGRTHERHSLNHSLTLSFWRAVASWYG